MNPLKEDKAIRQTGYIRECVQELLNAVVVQAAKDYRKECVKLIHTPEDRRARKEITEIEEFFLSEDFKGFSRVDGSYLLRRLEKENEDLKDLVKAVRSAEVELRAGYEVCRKMDDPEILLLLLPGMIRRTELYRELRRSVPQYASSLCPLMPEYKDIQYHLKIWRRGYADKREEE